MEKEEVFELAHEADIERIVGRYVNLKREGHHMLGLCPFHDDKRLGSFRVTPGKQIFKCWACGEGGGPVKFVSKYLGCSRYEAALRICEDEGMITQAEAQELRKGNEVALTERVRHAKQQSLVRDISEKASPDWIETVDSAFAAAAGGKEGLSAKFQSILREERKLTESDLADYFTFPAPSNRLFWERFYSILIEQTKMDKKEISETLLGVPGFFLNAKGKLTFLSLRKANVGILIHDRARHVSGIQMRTMSPLKPGEARYHFFSSGFADGSNSVGTKGCGCGFVEDVLFPTKRWCGAIAVTEGRFKAVTLSHLGFLTVNMHSISNWRPAGSAALDLAREYHARRFVLAYDQEENRNVDSSLDNLFGIINQAGIPIDVAIWDPKYGKGIDDVVNAGHIDKISRVPINASVKKAS